MLFFLALQFLHLFAPLLLACSAHASQLLTRITSDCSTSGPVSCENTTAVDTCCTEYPGGVLLQTQFWDTDVPGSPLDSWTIHGLWPDNCDGTYLEYCDSSRDYNISALLTEQGADTTLEYMEQYWLNDDGTNGELWDHEWAAHGTCYSTLEPSCLPSGSPVGSEAVAFFETVVQLFQTLPTYNWLADAGITPSNDQTYALSDILSALESASGGYTPYVGCSDGQLGSIYWYFHISGSVINGNFIPINSLEDSSCPDSDIQYLPKQD